MTIRSFCTRLTARGAAACAVLTVAACSGGPAAPKPTEVPGTVVLTVSVAGATADGRVTSSPAGIDCSLTNSTPGGTCTASFRRNSAVTLTATAGAGSNFGVWSGGCSGSNSSCVVTLSSAASAGAAFTPIPVAVTTTTLAGGTAGAAYTATLAATGGNGTFAWSVTSGALPAGLTLNSSTGAITGTPTAAGTSNFSVTATSLGRPAVQALSIAVTAVVSGIEFNVLSVGATSSCATANTVGAPVYCWGSNASGELGIGSADITGRAQPTLVSLPTGVAFRRVSVGDAHACALSTTGALYCWGKNTSGQVGIGTISSSVPTPALIASGTAFTEISAGGTITCAVVETSREGRCWGNNDQGQLGDGTVTLRSTPTTITGGHGWLFVIAGSTHACGVQFVSVNDVGGRVRCWGRGSEGQLGDGVPRAIVTTPTVVDSTMLYLRVSPGINANHTCAVDAAGALKCWGSNAVGQLGDGTTTNRSTPVRIAVSRQFTSVSASKDHGCAVDIGGLMVCWGENVAGVLGDGTTTSRLLPTPVVQGTSTFRFISTGSQHSCALGGTSVSRVQCWGTNVQGQLGTGSTSPGNSTIPVAVFAP